MSKRIKGHYVPKFHLINFTHGGTETSDLFVLDKHRLKVWETTPKGAANETDMYAIDPPPGVDSQVIEKKFGEMEHHFADVIRQVVSDRRLPTDKERRNWLMNYITLLSVRVPFFRDRLQELTNTVYTKALQVQLAHPEGRKSFEKIIEETGGTGKVTVEMFQQAITEGAITFQNPKNNHIRMMLELTDPLLIALSERQWRLWTVEEHAPDLICSDVPVALVPRKDVFGPYRIGFAMPNTYVFVPISRRMVMVGVYEPPVVSLTLNRHTVAIVNSAIANAAQQIYFAGPDFIFSMGDQKIGNKSDMLAMLKEWSVAKAGAGRG